MKDGAIETGNQSEFVVDFASRLNRIRVVKPRRRALPDRRVAPVVYVFPARRSFASFTRARKAASPADAPPPKAADAPPPTGTRGFSARLRQRALLIGALACYALILFNLIYGIVTIGYSRAAAPAAPSRSGAATHRSGAQPVDFRAPLGATMFAGVCQPEVKFDDTPPVALRRAAAPARKQAYQ